MVIEKASSKPGKWRRVFVIGFFAIAIALIGSELALRSMGLGKPLLLQRDAAAGYIIQPNQTLHRLGGYTHINAYGMRADDLPMSKPPGVFRVLFVGDSFAYGTTQVDQSKIFTQILQHELPSQIHRPVQVLNASAGGWAIPNEVGYVRSRGLFNADLVMLVLNQGDPGQPFEAFDPNDYTADHHPLFALQEAWQRYSLVRLFPGKPGTPQVATSSEKQIEAQNLASLDQLLAITRAANVPLAIAYIPTPAFPESPAPLIAWCADRHVTLIDLTPVASHWPAEGLLLPDHAHYNTKGNRLIADQLEKNWSLVMPAAGEPATGARP